MFCAKLGMSLNLADMAFSGDIWGDAATEQDGVRDGGDRACVGGGGSGAVERGRGVQLLQWAAEQAAFQGGAPRSGQGRH